ncbi:MAG TPA: PKD domain-containing protein, partial [Flavisolibacter sp.]|nr:PKD domain-containing protein [Flavisolibacter sp.]
KASPDGKTIATKGLNNIELFDFDNVNGVITHKFTITAPGHAYAIEFSPDGTKLYANAFHMWPSGGILHDDIIQYDLQAGPPAAVQNSESVIRHYSGSAYLQVGPDGKIYQISDSLPNKYLNVIHRPNLKGTACRFQKYAIDLDPANAYFNHSIFKAGDALPSFVQSFFYRPKIEMQQTCFGDTARFDLGNRAYADSATWNFGDPASGALNTSKSFTPRHFYATGGTYTVQAIVHFNFTSDTISQTIHIPATIVKPNLGNDTTLCQGDTLRLHAYQYGATYEWQDRFNFDSIYMVTKPALTGYRFPMAAGYVPIPSL